jgi:hypothetical protein
MVYLACPYTHPDPKVREERFQLANRIASELMRQGTMVFSPISHSHPIAEYGLPKDWEFWEKYDRWFLERCEKLLIVKALGWDESIGIREEIGIAKQRGIEIEYRLP